MGGRCVVSGLRGGGRITSRIFARALGTPSRVYIVTTAISAIVFATGIVVLIITTAIALPILVSASTDCGDWMT